MILTKKEEVWTTEVRSPVMTIVSLWGFLFALIFFYADLMLWTGIFFVTALVILITGIFPLRHERIR